MIKLQALSLKPCRKKKLHYSHLSLQVSFICLISLLKTTSSKENLKERKQQFWNLMRIILLKLYYSLFSAVTDCTLTDRWSTFHKGKSKSFDWQCLLSRAISSKKAKHEKYSVKAHCWKYRAWDMKAIWKYSICLLVPN